MKKSVLNLKNKTVGDIDLDINIFGVKKFPDLINLQSYRILNYREKTNKSMLSIV